METEDHRRPYAATANTVAVAQRVRTRNMPDKIDDEFLRICGIPDVVFGRVQEALRFLSFTTEDGAPTALLKALATAPENEYRSLLEGAIREAYRDDFAKIDPARDSQPQIIEAFRTYEPRSQTSRMVMLFLGLCREAGMEVLDAPRSRGMATSPGRARARVTTTKRSSSPSPTTPTHTTPPPALTPGLIFGVTESDLAELDQSTFDDVWLALGKVARARALRDARSASPVQTVVIEDDDDEPQEDSS